MNLITILLYLLIRSWLEPVVSLKVIALLVGLTAVCMYIHIHIHTAWWRQLSVRWLRCIFPLAETDISASIYSVLADTKHSASGECEQIWID